MVRVTVKEVKFEADIALDSGRRLRVGICHVCEVMTSALKSWCATLLTCNATSTFLPYAIGLVPSLHFLSGVSSPKECHATIYAVGTTQQSNVILSSPHKS